MFDESTAGERLAWVCLLCHVKATGRAGKSKVRAKVLARRYDLSERSVVNMLKSAQENGAVEIDGDNITLCNWYIYNDKQRKSNLGEMPQNREIRQTSKKSLPLTTNHEPLTTNHKPQEVKTPPTPPKGGECVRRQPTIITKQQAEEIYLQYPKHTGKRAAITSITNAAKRLAKDGYDDPVGHLARSTLEYAKSEYVKTTDRRYIPAPSVWFNQDRFDDDRAEWNAQSDTPPKQDWSGWKPTVDMRGFPLHE